MKPSAFSFIDHLAMGEELDKSHRQIDSTCECVWSVLSCRLPGLSKKSNPMLKKLETAKRLVSEVQSELMSLCYEAMHKDLFWPRKLYDPEKRNPDLEPKSLLKAGKIRK
jgi:hypothetical protein